MAVIEELIRQEENGSLSFGNHLMEEKKKVSGFEANGNLYKVKTFKEITRLEKNDSLLLETVPGATVHNFAFDEKKITFSLESTEDVQVTMELEPEHEYKVLVDDVTVGRMKTHVSGKVMFNVELSNKEVQVKLEKVM